MTDPAGAWPEATIALLATQLCTSYFYVLALAYSFLTATCAMCRGAPLFFLLPQNSALVWYEGIAGLPYTASPGSRQQACMAGSEAACVDMPFDVLRGASSHCSFVEGVRMSLGITGLCICEGICWLTGRCCLAH